MTNRILENTFDLKEINITYDSIETKWSKMTPTAVKDEVNKIYSYIRNDPQKAINEIKKLNKIYKDIPVLNNFLCSCYEAIGDYENAEKIAIRNYNLFPKYLFAKTNYAQICLKNGKTDKIKKIFEGKFDLNSIYPSRKEFHISEFLSFMGVWSVYYYKIGEEEIARSYHKVMKKVDHSHPLTKSIKQQIYPPLLIRILAKILGKERIKLIKNEIAEKKSAQNADRDRDGHH